MESGEKKFFYQPEAQGLVYPIRAYIQQVQWHDGEWFQVWDATGWNGFEVVPDEEIALIKGEEAAIKFALQYVRFSDTEKVFNAAVSLLNKEAGSFKLLKDAVAWQDRH